MATIVAEKPTVEHFPKAEVVAALTAELIDLAQAEAETRGIALPSDAAGIRKAAVPIDSLSVVDILCLVEPIIKVELRESIVQTGGYTSIDDALEHLVPRIERAWVRKKEQKK
jgi:hypothetical protein